MRERVPWNKGRTDPRAGTAGSPWKGNGGARAGAGGVLGQQKSSTIELGARIEQARHIVRDVIGGDEGIKLIFAKAYALALQGSSAHARLCMDYAVGKPREIVNLEPPPGEFPAGGNFRVVLSDGTELRPAAAGPLPLPARPLAESGK